MMSRRNTSNTKQWLAPTSVGMLSRPSFAFIQLAARLRNGCAALARDTGSSLQKFAILSCLEEGGPMFHADLAARVRIDKGNLVSLVGDLSSKMLVEFVQDDRDRRCTRLRLLWPGERCLREIEAKLDRFESEFFGYLSEDERRALRNLVTRLVARHC